MSLPAVRYVDVQGRTVAYARLGDGPPLVIAGNWITNIDGYELVPPLARCRDGFASFATLATYDQPGTGQSEGVAAELALDRRLPAAWATAGGRPRWRITMSWPRPR